MPKSLQKREAPNAVENPIEEQEGISAKPTQGSLLIRDGS